MDKLINLLGSPNSWPCNLQTCLNRHHDLFRDWETGPSNGATAAEYDLAVHELEAVLRQYALVGWHCTRLIEVEIASIWSGGMRLLDVDMLHRRVDAAVGADENLAGRLKAKNQAKHPWRAGMIWFCFFPPRRAGESGIGRFFRHWGGEALYNCHECDPQTVAAISAIGTPCIVEAVVPIASLKRHGGLHNKVARRYLINRGYRTVEPVDHEDAITLPLPAANIRRIIPFPSPAFKALTGCDEWEQPIFG